MTISGMTGFARAEGRLSEELGAQRWLWEAKSVNGRGLDVKLRTPLGFDGLEQPARSLAARMFKRGSLQASLTLTRDAGASAAVEVDAALIARLLEAGAPHIKAGHVKKPRWDGMLSLRGVLVSEDSSLGEDARARAEAALLAGLGTAFEGLATARASEGRMLATVLGEAADRLDGLVARARATAAAAPTAALERIKSRLSALAPDVVFDQQRLAQEAALAAMRADVAEELERLAAHTTELRILLATPEAAGRRLDFLGQELTREANTLCSKSQDLELTRIGLDLKAVVDQIKEQAANVE
ncbi:MAG: YicC family protein [Hyphomonadaceae bacterium]|nr:YicC family protein [Hyphomonadaceae bacterium]